MWQKSPLTSTAASCPRRGKRGLHCTLRCSTSAAAAAAGIAPGAACVLPRPRCRCRCRRHAAAFCLRHMSCCLLCRPAASQIPNIRPFSPPQILRCCTFFPPQILNIRTFVVKFLSAATAVGSGLPVGPEGPMIHMVRRALLLFSFRSVLLSIEAALLHWRQFLRQPLQLRSAALTPARPLAAAPPVPPAGRDRGRGAEPGAQHHAGHRQRPVPPLPGAHDGCRCWPGNPPGSGQLLGEPVIGGLSGPGMRCAGGCRPALPTWAPDLYAESPGPTRCCCVLTSSHKHPQAVARFAPQNPNDKRDFASCLGCAW